MRTIGAMTVGVLLCLLLLAAGACWFVGPPPTERKPWLLPAELAGGKRSLAELLAARETFTARGIDEPAAVPGVVQVVQPPTRCTIPPMPWPPTRQWLVSGAGEPSFPYPVTFARCTAGKEFLVSWHTQRAVSVPGRPAPTNAVILMSLRPRELPLGLDSIGMPSCWLQGHPDLMLAPTPILWSDSGDRITFGVVREHSRVHLWWTPPLELLGLTLYAQCVVEEPGVNSAGLLISPLVSFTIGN